MTGRTATPPLFDTLVALGRDRTLERLDRAIDAAPARRDAGPRRPGVALDRTVAGLGDRRPHPDRAGRPPGRLVAARQRHHAVAARGVPARSRSMPDSAGRPPPASGRCSSTLVGYYGMVQLRYGYGGGRSWIFWGLGAAGRRPRVRRRRALVARAGPSTAGDRPRPARGGRRRRRGATTSWRGPRDRRRRVHRLRAARAAASAGRATTGSAAYRRLLPSHASAALGYSRSPGSRTLTRRSEP